ncbi:ImmA/IrrE family metallo-endopeptidase [Sporosarcina sp. FA9]|uniref:ImmA/IrrE family metallo-endopeptidase n=1 Tax=Sporosarcina sp. FA9 TaxID=3413030 RepID=UPI003F65E571
MTLYIAKPTSRKKIRDLTNVLRRAAGLYDEPYFPVVEFLELAMPELFTAFEYEIVCISEMPNEYGVTYPEKNKICIREDVYERAIEGVERDRFTIAHEIGHFILHKPGNIVLARLETIEEIPAYRQPEWQANTFAGELLAPPQIIKGLNLNEISSKCGVSLQVGGIQLKNIGK